LSATIKRMDFLESLEANNKAARLNSRRPIRHGAAAAECETLEMTSVLGPLTVVAPEEAPRYNHTWHDKWLARQQCGVYRRS
jgi:hypothetical protein